MLVNIEEIQANGLKLTEAIAPSVLTAALSESGLYSLVDSKPLSVSFSKVSGQVHLQGEFTASLKTDCHRCTREMVFAVPVNFSLRMVPSSQFHAEKAENDAVGAESHKKATTGKRRAKDDADDVDTVSSFELDEVDAEPFNGKTIDLDPIVREQLILALPVTVVCRDDCKGLCTECGEDLNVRDCGHGKEKKVDARLAKLKDLRLKN